MLQPYTEAPNTPTMPEMRIELAEDSYRLVIDSTPSEPAAYGEPLEAEIGGKTYLAFADVDPTDDEQVESTLDSWIYEVAAKHDDPEVVIEDVEEFT